MSLTKLQVCMVNYSSNIDHVTESSSTGDFLNTEEV